MTDMKPWYLSRTIWAALVTMAIAVLRLFDMPVGETEHAAVTDAVMNLVAAAAGLTAIAGRLAARDRIG